MTGRMIALLAVLYLGAIGMAMALSSLFLKLWRHKQERNNAMSALRTPANSQPASSPEGNQKRGYFWAIVLVVFAVLGFVFAMVFSEVILASALYVAWINAVTSATRLPDEMANALTIVLVSVFSFALWPYVTRSLFRHRGETKRMRLMLASLVLTTFFVGKHYVSQPGSDEYFNSVTGAPMWKYYVSDEGLIVQAPLYKKFNTQDGSLLKLMDPAVAKAHREQEKKRQATPPVQPQAGQGQTKEQPQPKGELRLPDAHSAQAKEIANANGMSKPFKANPKWVTTRGQYPDRDFCSNVVSIISLGNGTYGPFNLWVEDIHIAESQTQVQVAVAVPNGMQSKSVFHRFDFGWYTNKEMSFLVDSDGYTYELVSDEGPFNLGTSPNITEKWFLQALTVHPGERYRFLLSFPRLRTYWPDFELRVPHFPPITIKFVE